MIAPESDSAHGGLSTRGGGRRNQAPAAALDHAPRLLRKPFEAPWRERLLVLGGAAAAVALALGLGLAYARDATVELLGLVPASVFAVGKFLPLWGVTGQSHFSPWELGGLIWSMDTVTALVLVYSLEVLYRIPLLAAGLARVQTNAALVLTAYPRIRRAAVAGVVIFVLFPVAGTGAIGGCFLGMLLGLRRFVLIAAVSAGGLLGGMLMAFAASNFAGAVTRVRTIQDQPAVQWGLMTALVAAAVVLVWWLNRAYRRALARARRHAAAPAPSGRGEV
ncbi:hypothetical protein [Haliangium sp.]|uniref:hypothetical protein n=1 Tax=Haliangium sp. TaxID=2663208 RepID=UPI003D0C8BAD